MFFWRRVAPQIPEEGLKPTATPGYTRNFRDLNNLVSRGKSFSGYERNSLFVNQSGNGFTDVGGLLGVDFDDDARAVATMDWDMDGDLDLWITNRTAPQVRLLKNNQPSSKAFVSFRLTGNGTTTNRDAIGARLTLSNSTGEKQIRTAHAGDGFLAQSSAWIHFGLGKETDGLSLSVSWPGGKTETFDRLRSGNHYTITQGDSTPHTWSPPRTSSTEALPAGDAITSNAKPSRNGFWVANPLPFPRLTFADSEGATRSTDDLRGKPLLVNLWATWCAPCVEELAMFAEHSDNLRERGVAILALNVDSLSADKTPTDSPTKPAELLARIGFELPYGFAQRDNLAKIEILIEYLSSRRETLSIPSSFLIDSDGNVVAVYQEPVSWEQLSEDVALLKGSSEARLARATPRPGRWVEDPRQGVDLAAYVGDYATLFANNGFPEDSQRLYSQIRSTAITDENARTYYNQAKAAAQQGSKQQAIDYYRKAIELDPKYGQALTGLGAVLLTEKRLDEAQSLFEQALRIDPNHATALVNLAMIDQARGDHAKSLERLRKVVTRNPGFAQAQLNLGSLLASMKKYDEAIRHLLKAVESNPKLVPAQMNLGYVFAKTNQWKEAERRYRIVQQLSPRNGYAVLGLGNALTKQGQHREASIVYQNAIAAGYRTSNVYTRLAKSRLQLGDRQAAMKALKEAISLDPKNMEAKRALAQMSNVSVE